MIDIDFIIGYSTVKIERVSDRYLFSYNFREIEEQKLHLLLFYIKCVSDFWEHVVSAHGAATALNRELPGIFCFYLFTLNLCLPVHEKHKHFPVWERFVSAHRAATTLKKESHFFVSLF